jgi:hypothetical protein
MENISEQLLKVYGGDKRDAEFRLGMLSYMFDTFAADFPELRMRIQVLIDVAKEREVSNA